MHIAFFIKVNPNIVEKNLVYSFFKINLLIR